MSYHDIVLVTYFETGKFLFIATKHRLRMRWQGEDVRLFRWCVGKSCYARNVYEDWHHDLDRLAENEEVEEELLLPWTKIVTEMVILGKYSWHYFPWIQRP